MERQSCLWVRSPGQGSVPSCRPCWAAASGPRLELSAPLGNGSHQSHGTGLEGAEVPQTATPAGRNAARKEGEAHLWGRHSVHLSLN